MRVMKGVSNSTQYKSGPTATAIHIQEHVQYSSKTKGYIPRITASRHLIGSASFVISLARSISLWDKTGKEQEENQNKLKKGLCQAEQRQAGRGHMRGGRNRMIWSHKGRGGDTTC